MSLSLHQSLMGPVRAFMDSEVALLGAIRTQKSAEIY